MRLVWTRLANTDRKEIREYIAQDNPAAALALDELLSEKANRLIDHPGLGHPGRVIGTRELVAHQNYILVYDMAGDLVRVLRVLHAARQDNGRRRSDDSADRGNAESKRGPRKSSLTPFFCMQH